MDGAGCCCMTGGMGLGEPVVAGDGDGDGARRMVLQASAPGV